MSDYTDVGNWTAMNDVEEAEDGVMYWAVFEYTDDYESYPGGIRHITTYDLTNEQAWRLVREHNES